MSENVDMTAVQLKLEDRSTSFDEKDVWADDCLGGLNDKSKTLIELVQGQQRPLTICLDGEWGSGKTFFLARLAHDYNSAETGGRAIYYNAWQDDFLDDPLLAIICQLEKVVKDDPDNNLFANIKEAALPCLAKVGLSVAKQFVKNKIGIDVESIDIDDVKSRAEKLYGSYHEMESSRKVLRGAIANLAENSFKSTQKPLLFIIDELDRCRPTFAIELLERIKHLFSVSHMVFIVGVDLGELGKSIQSVYGDIKSADYLHRFFDVEIKLPKADKRGFVDNLWKEHELEGLLKPFGFNVQTQHTMAQAFKQLIAYRDMTLRQIEKSVRTFALLATSGQQAACHWPFLTAIAVVLKVMDGTSYEKFIRMEYNLGDLINTLYPRATYKEVDTESGIYNEVSQLTTIAYFISDTSATHLKLEGLKKAMSEKRHISFDPEIMPECFRECPQEYIQSFYHGFIHLLTKDNQMMYQSYRYAPADLQRLDKELQFIG